MRRTLFYAACSMAISLTFFMGLYGLAGRYPIFWMALVGMNAALWSSFPRYRSAWGQTVTTTLTLVVLANPIVSLLARELWPEAEQTPRMAPNTVVQTNIMEGGLPGLKGLRRFSVDARGFRTNMPVDYARKPAGVVRIVGIGASTMEEGLIDDRQTWTNVVADRLAKSLGRKVEMINTAYSGLRAEHHLSMLAEVEAYAPDVAVFLMGINDWNHAILERFKADYPPPPRGIRAWIGLLSVNHTLLYRGIEIAEVAAISMLDRWGMDLPVVQEDGVEITSQANSLARPIKQSFRPDSVSEEYAVTVGKIMERCRNSRIQCVFIDQPTAYHPGITPDLGKRLWMTPLKAPYTLSFDDISHVAQVYNNWLGKKAEEQGFRFCSISPLIPPTTDYFFDDCHYNDNGSRMVARAVADCLSDLNL